MLLNIAPHLWHALCQTAAQYPTCTLRLHQHQGCVKSFTVEHGPVVDERSGTGSEAEPYGVMVPDLTKM